MAGGRGSRLAEETEVRPKPMVTIGGMPILWHIMKIFSAHGVNDFVICLGYKGYIIKEYFANYFLHNSDVTFDMQTNEMQVHENEAEPWKVTLIDTGEDSQTGGRLLRVKKYLDEDELFCFTYGDGVGDIDIDALVTFHKTHGKLATVCAVRAPGRFGTLSLDGDTVSELLINRLADVRLLKNFTGFGLYDQKLIQMLRQVDEPYPYVRGLIFEVTDKVEVVEYVQPERFRGVTTNNFYSLYDMAMLGISSHSKVPLRLAVWFGFLSALLSFLIAVGYGVYKLMYWDTFSAGVAPLVIGVFLFSSIQLVFIGIVGEYLGSIHTKISKRPHVFERERINFK